MIDDFLTAADDLPEHVLDAPRTPVRPAIASSLARSSNPQETTSASTVAAARSAPAASTALLIEVADKRSTLTDLVDAATAAASSDNLPAVQVSLTAIAAGILLAASVIQSRTAPQALVLSVSHPWALEVTANRGAR